MIDTFKLKIIDTLVFNQKRKIYKVFNKHYKDGLKIYIFSSSSVDEGDTLHFWVQGIGIIKVVYENCWNRSFELNFEDRLSKSKNKLFTELLKTIKKNYEDPKWLDAPCNIKY